MFLSGRYPHYHSKGSKQQGKNDLHYFCVQDNTISTGFYHMFQLNAVSMTKRAHTLYAPNTVKLETLALLNLSETWFKEFWQKKNVDEMLVKVLLFVLYFLFGCFTLKR